MTRILRLVAVLFFACVVLAYAHDGNQHDASHQGAKHHEVPSAGQWEGSSEGKAYSEFNHHLAGLCIIIIGFSELYYGASVSLFALTRFLLPVFMVVVGLFLLIWSDHDGWPFGSTFMQTFLTGEWETVQHKWFGILALSIGVIEWLRRTGHLAQYGWKFPLPAFAIVGGLSLFLHSHGIHPAAHKIALHHAVMGIMAITAGSTKFLSDWKASQQLAEGRSSWGLAWATLVILIGIQLLLYSE